ncbi:hypothetical protein IMZ31_22740 (plasmid) [Pontibacillus sp. ALD_SL1]|uniref:hypothetical protein n=1 Tax=Pontibacillus sp. ALD_SL1 TaxID=2777185 RepID=UPI001A95C1B7|nr:hypothetical protein [Pontibacillus sp. ALD_SL1]QST02274.1 hypothetical protein IMZ31_22740 [Pontibacillus sp. ALD_SL1]
MNRFGFLMKTCEYQGEELVELCYKKEGATVSVEKNNAGYLLTIYQNGLHHKKITARFIRDSEDIKAVLEASLWRMSKGV